MSDAPGKLGKFGKVLAGCTAAAQVYGCSRWSVLARVARLRAFAGFSPKEAFLWGLADPRRPFGDTRNYASRSLLYRLQRRDNLPGLAFTTEDKAFFYAFCAGAGIRTPRLFGVYHRQGGWSAQGPALRSAADWQRFFLEEIPAEFVIKPSKGVYARGLRVFSREGSSLRDRQGHSLTVPQLLAELDQDPHYDLWIVQERVRNHAELEQLSGSQAVQTARTVTYLDADGTARVLFACFKVIASTLDSDNFDYGNSGNLLTNVALDTGRLENALGKAPGGIGLVPHRHHPQTGVEIEGFPLPYWPQLVELACNAALKFRPLRTIGWDIALTPDGPAILEGNVWWDALHNTHGTMPRYLDLHRT